MRIHLFLFLEFEYVPREHVHDVDVETQHDGKQDSEVVDTVEPRSLTLEEKARRLVLVLEALIVIVQIAILVIDWW